MFTAYSIDNEIVNPEPEEIHEPRGATGSHGEPRGATGSHGEIVKNTAWVVKAERDTATRLESL